MVAAVPAAAAIAVAAVVAVEGFLVMLSTIMMQAT